MRSAMGFTNYTATRVGLRVALLLLFLSLSIGSVEAEQVAWPEPEHWVQAVTKEWGALTDPVGDFSGANGNRELDVVTGPGGSAFAWTFDGENLFVRVVLLDSPLHDTVRLQNKFWMAYLNTAGINAYDRYHSDYGIVLSESGIKTTYADISQPVTTDNVNYDTGLGTTTVNQSQAPTAEDPYRYIYPHPDLGYMVRVADAADVEPSGGNGLWYLEFFVPLSWLSVSNPAVGVTPPDTVTPTSRVRIAIGTSTQGNNIIKDLAGLADSLDINHYYAFVALHTDPQSVMPGGGGYGVLRETRDDAEDAESGYWQPGETIRLEGYGWTVNESVEARIVGPDEDESVRWEGLVPTNGVGEVESTGNPYFVAWATPADAHAGIYSIQAKDPDPGAEFTTRDSFTIEQYAGVSSAAPTTELTAIQNHSVLYPVTIQNTGNAPDTFSVVLSTAPPGWSWSVHLNVNDTPGEVVSEVTLPQYGTAELIVVVTPSDQVAPGTSESVTLSFTSAFDNDVQAQHTFETLAVGEPEALTLISGDQQTGFPQTSLEEPLWVRVVDAHGYGVPGVTVNFAIAGTPQGAAGQSLSELSGVSSMQGDVQTGFTLGSLMGRYQITASADGLDGSPLTFDAFAWHGEPTQIAWLGPDEASVGEVEPLTIEVRNAAGEPTVVRVTTTLTLSTSTALSEPFFEDLEATQSIATRVLAPGDSSVQVYYRETTAGPAVLTAERTSGESVGSADHAIMLLAGPPAKLAFTQQPQDAEAHETLVPVTVQIQDVFGNHVPPDGETVISLSIEPDDEGELLGSVAMTAQPDGSVTFVDLNVTRFGVKRLHATAPSLTSAESDNFTIWGSYLETSTYVVVPQIPVLRGAILTYTAEIVNTGNLSTRDMLLEVRIPDGTSYESAQSGACESLSGPNGGAVHCEVHPVAVGESAVFAFDVKVERSNADQTELNGSAVVTDDWNAVELPHAGPLATIVHAPVIHLSQTVWPSQHVAPGDTIYVTIELTNTGHAQATNVVVLGRVPGSVRYEAGSAESSNGAAVSFQHEEGGDWFETDLDDEGAPVPVVAIRWIAPEIGALTGEVTFEYRAILP